MIELNLKKSINEAKEVLRALGELYDSFEYFTDNLDWMDDDLVEIVDMIESLNYINDDVNAIIYGLEQIEKRRSNRISLGGGKIMKIVHNTPDVTPIEEVLEDIRAKVCTLTKLKYSSGERVYLDEVLEIIDNHLGYCRTIVERKNLGYMEVEKQ